MTLLKAYGRGLWDGKLILGYTLLLSLTLLIVTPFLMIALRSVGKGWFGRLWFRRSSRWIGIGGLWKWATFPRS